ncbi:Uncharacterised protein [uncultured archaeon]|nr:Uncharacterised protein [uncultured archaeon]
MTNVSINDLELILTGARAIQNGEHFQREIEKLRESGEKELPMNVVYELAETFRIQRESIDKYMQLRFPSKERQLESLEECGGVPTREVIKSVYVKTFLRDLDSHFPSEKFSFSECMIVREKEKIKVIKRRFFKEKKIIEKLDYPLAYFNFALIGGISMTLYDSSFIEACKDSLMGLNKKFEKFVGKIEIRYAYNPHLDD